MLNYHLDTDFGGDPDDLAALLMLLGMPEVRLSGITTVLDDTGARAGAAYHILEAVGRTDIPLHSGARMGLTTSERPGIREDFWPDVAPRLSPDPGDAIASICRSLAMNAVITMIGPQTNIAMMRRQRDEMLNGRRVVHMGGFIRPATDGYPQWPDADDFNIQFDTRAVEELYGSTALITMVPMPVAMQAWIIDADIERIAGTGLLGQRLADQLRTWGADQNWQDIGQQHTALPNDLAGIMWDPVTALVATGWDGATIEPMNLVLVAEDGVIHFERNSAIGRPVNVVTAIDTAAFRSRFLDAIDTANALIGS